MKDPARHHERKQKIVKGINLNRVSRAYLHYLAIKENLPSRTAKERDEAAFFGRKIERYYKQAQRLLTARLIFSAILYASILVNILQVIPFLHFLVEFVELGNSLVGTGLAFLAVMVLTLQINLKLQLINQSLAHVIALYQSNPKRDTDATIKALRKTL